MFLLQNYKIIFGLQCHLMEYIVEQNWFANVETRLPALKKSFIF